MGSPAKARRSHHAPCAASHLRTGATTGSTRISSATRTPADTGPPTWPTTSRYARPTDCRPATSPKVAVSTCSIGRCDRGPHAEPLLRAVGFVPLYLGEPELRGEAHRAGVGGLGKEHHRFAGKL